MDVCSEVSSAAEFPADLRRSLLGSPDCRATPSPAPSWQSMAASSSCKLLSGQGPAWQLKLLHHPQLSTSGGRAASAHLHRPLSEFKALLQMLPDPCPLYCNRALTCCVRHCKPYLQNLLPGSPDRLQALLQMLPAKPLQ